MRRIAMRAILAIVFMSTVVLMGSSGTASALPPIDGPVWMPLKNPNTAVGCTWSNGCLGSYHGYFAIDFIGVTTGEPVFAAGQGRVVAVCRSWPATTSEQCAINGGFGNFVAIQHYDGRLSLYGHLSTVESYISPGVGLFHSMQIGTVGNTGNSQGAHLHYEERTGATLNANGVIESTSGFGARVAPLSKWVAYKGKTVEYPNALGYSAWGGTGGVRCSWKVGGGEPCSSRKADVPGDSFRCCDEFAGWMLRGTAQSLQQGGGTFCIGFPTFGEPARQFLFDAQEAAFWGLPYPAGGTVTYKGKLDSFTVEVARPDGRRWVYNVTTSGTGSSRTANGTVQGPYDRGSLQAVPTYFLTNSRLVVGEPAPCSIG